MRICVIDWYKLYINHPGGSRLAKTIRGVCFWKGVVMQSELYDNLCKIFQQFKKRNHIYGSFSPNNFAELNPWDTVHVYLIVPYFKYIRQYHPGSAIIKNNFSLAFMTMIVPDTDWLKLLKCQHLTSTR